MRVADKYVPIYEDTLVLKRLLQDMKDIGGELGMWCCGVAHHLPSKLETHRVMTNYLSCDLKDSRRALAMLATKMRLSQQSTTNHRGNKIKKPLKKLWD